MIDRADTDRVLACCAEHGFTIAGVCDVSPTEYAAELRAWIAQGRHGEMSYLEQNLEALLDPNSVLDGVQSVICVAERYHSGHRDPVAPSDHGRIARYARGDDYHKRMRRRLQQCCDALREMYPDAAFRACVDTAPILEREYAQRAGLGAVGKNTLLITRGIGSYMFLGEMLTTLSLPPSTPAKPDPCGTCTRCIDACPTDAITPWSVDATRCISYLTIEHRSDIDDELAASLDGWVFGCDVCQEVCPHNRPTRKSKAVPVHEDYAARRRSLPLLDVLGWSEDDRRTVFTNSAMKRARLSMMKRNALLAVGPDAPEGVRARIAAIRDDETEDAMVRAAASRFIGLHDA